jgi:hypothetical protein
VRHCRLCIQKRRLRRLNLGTPTARRPYPFFISANALWRA